MKNTKLYKLKRFVSDFDKLIIETQKIDNNQK